MRNLPTPASEECLEYLLASTSSWHHFHSKQLPRPLSSYLAMKPFLPTLRLVLSSQLDLQSENYFSKISLSLVKLTLDASTWPVQAKVDSISMSSSL